MHCSEAELAIAIWDLPLQDVHGNHVKIPFYVTPGDGVLLLGNEILHKSNLLGPRNILEVPPGVCDLSKKLLTFHTYNDPVSLTDKDRVRTYLFVVPAKTNSFKTYFVCYQALSTTGEDHRTLSKGHYAHGKVAKRFAIKLHGYSHLPSPDMIELCKRGGIMNSVLRQALKTVVEKCTSCKSTGRPLASRKVSFGKVLSTFNAHVQIDFMYIAEMDNVPILHLVDVHTAFSVTIIMSSREMEEATRAIDTHWCQVHGPPSRMSGDQEFNSKVFRDFLDYYDIEFKDRPARRHNKLGVVESKNAVVRTIAQRILKDAEFFRASRGIHYTRADVLSRATYLSNVLYGGKRLSSFEMARGYTPSVAGLPQSKNSQELVTAHEEQVARRALRLLNNGRSPHVVHPDSLSKGQRVYFFKRGPKFGKWQNGYVRSVDPHMVTISTNKEHKGMPVRAALEDVRISPTSSLLEELDSIHYLFPRSSSLIEENNFDNRQHDQSRDILAGDDPLPPIPESQDNLQKTAEDCLVDLNAEEQVTAIDRTDKDELPDAELSNTGDVLKLFESESVLWASHPSSRDLFDEERCMRMVDMPYKDVGTDTIHQVNTLLGKQSYPDATPQDIGKSFVPARPEKDIGSVPVRTPSPLPCTLTSSEQKLLQQAREVLGNRTASEFQLQFLPRWLVEKSIAREKENYEGSYEEVHIKSLPPHANVITSHHFFQVKHDGEEDKLKLKCRLVPHGNRDRDKDKVRKDSATAQFPVIRIVLSLAAIIRFSLATIDIKGAYLQGGSLGRDIYVRPPKGWATSPAVVWRLIKPAYGIVESGRLWQITVESWMSGKGIIQVPGLPQLFVKRRSNGRISLVIAKVVDDFLIAGPRQAIDEFHCQISERFTIGRFVTGPDLIFNRLHIHQDADCSVQVNMQEYLEKVLPIQITRERRKEWNSPCSMEEITRYLGLTGSLNFLGHGVLPQASFAASHLQQRVGRLTVSHLVEANKVLREIQALHPSLLYRSVPSSVVEPRYLAFSDASQGSSSYGQTGYISGIFLPAGGGEVVYHTLDWLSCKQARVSFSSIGAEILAAAAAADRGALMSESMQEVNGSPVKLPFVLTIDSHGLYSTVTTLHEGADYRLRPTVARMRDSFESGEISVMQWIPGKRNLADALTKRNVEMYRALNTVMTKGLISNDIFEKAERVTFTS